MSTDYIQRSTAVINGIEGLELVPHAMRLLAEGEPVALEQLAAAAVVSALRPTGQLADVRSAICRHGRFFASPQAAAQHPEGGIRSVEEAFAVDRAVVTQVGWAAG